jgi:hypothetical protein
MNIFIKKNAELIGDLSEKVAGREAYIKAGFNTVMSAAVAHMNKLNYTARLVFGDPEEVKSSFLSSSCANLKVFIEKDNVSHTFEFDHSKEKIESLFDFSSALTSLALSEEDRQFFSDLLELIRMAIYNGKTDVKLGKFESTNSFESAKTRVLEELAIQLELCVRLEMATKRFGELASGHMNDTVNKTLSGKIFSVGENLEIKVNGKTITEDDGVESKSHPAYGESFFTLDEDIIWVSKDNLVDNIDYRTYLKQCEPKLYKIIENAKDSIVHSMHADIIGDAQKEGYFPDIFRQRDEFEKEVSFGA